METKETEFGRLLLKHGIDKPCHREFIAKGVEDTLADFTLAKEWEVIGSATSVAEVKKMFKPLTREKKRLSTEEGYAYLAWFQTTQSYSAGFFRVGHNQSDPHAFIFSLRRPVGKGKRGVTSGKLDPNCDTKPLLFRPRNGRPGIVYTSGAVFCMGSGSTGQSDFNFNSLVPFVSSNLLKYGPSDTDPCALFGGGEYSTGGDRFAYKPLRGLMVRVKIMKNR